MKKLAEGQAHKKCGMDGADIKKHSVRVVEMLNRMQFKDGLTIDETILVTLYVVGAAMKMRGIVLDSSSSLDDALPPLVAGYTAGMSTKATQ